MSENSKIVNQVLRDINPKIAELTSLKPLQSKNKILIFIGAGSSVPFGIPNGSELLNSFRSIYKKEYNKIEELFKTETHEKTPLQIEDFLQYINSFIELNESPLGRTILKYYEIPWYKDIDKVKKLKSAIFKHIRKKCNIDEKNLQKAVNIYEKFLTPAKEKNIKLQIFTTNYDNVIESVCKDLRLQFDNGFIFDQIDRKQKWQNTFGTDDSYFDLFKIHGSIDWYLDKEDDIITIPVSENLENISDSFQTLMIYPVNFKNNNPEPFASLNSNFYEALESSIEIIVIGYSFRDDNILTPIKKKLEKEDCKMLIIDPNADKIKEKILENISENFESDIIKTENLKFEEWIENDSNWSSILENWEIDNNEIEDIIKDINNDIKYYIETGMDRAYSNGKDLSFKYNMPTLDYSKNLSAISALPLAIPSENGIIVPSSNFLKQSENPSLFTSLRIYCPHCKTQVQTFMNRCPNCHADLSHSDESDNMIK